MKRSPLLVFVLLLLSLPAVQAQSSVTLRSLVTGLQSPVALANAGDGTGRLFVVEQKGLIRLIKNAALLPTPFLDITGQVQAGGEKGLLGLAFHPRYRENGRFFVNYTTGRSGKLQTVIAEYHLSSSNADLAATQERVILTFDQPFENHNGGQLAFGPDGYLYIATGDGGSGGDPQRNGQNLGSLLGKILRIDVDAGSPYNNPADNPFIHTADARPEIWAYGLRNPWRFSFDRLTGRLFSADVGQGSWEEVDLIQAGGNYGWNRMEGTHCYPPSTTSCDQQGLVLPLTEYSHSEGVSVTGGYVYRGLSRRSPYWGAYVFGDFGSGVIWTLREESPGHWVRQELTRTGYNISSFGEDEAGEIYVVSYSKGSVERISFPSRAIIPHAADGRADGNLVKTTLFLVNPSAQPLAATVSFRDSNGEAASVAIEGHGTAPITVAVSPKSSLRLTTAGESEGLFSGWAEVSADGPVTAALLYQMYRDGPRADFSNLVTEAGLDASILGQELIGPVGRDVSQGFDSALALVNSADQPANLTLVLTSADGSVTRQESITLAAGEHYARFLGEIFSDLPDTVEGTIVVTGSSALAGVLLRTRGGILLSTVPLSD